MGLVRKVAADSVAAGVDGSIDIGAAIRKAVTDEIERRRLESLKAETADTRNDAEE